MNELTRRDYGFSTRFPFPIETARYPIKALGKIISDWYDHFTDFIQDPEIVEGISGVADGEDFGDTNSFAQNYLKPFHRDSPLLRDEALAIERGERRRMDLLRPDLVMAVFRLFAAEMRIKELLAEKD